MKNTCCHYDERKNECKILCEMQCEKRGKCSFCESHEEYNERMKKYNESIQPQIDIFMEVAKKKLWDKEKRERQLEKYLAMSQEKKNKYIKQVRSTIN